MLVTNILGRDDSVDTNNNKETGFILSFIQKDRVLAAVCFFALFYLCLELFCWHVQNEKFITLGGCVSSFVHLINSAACSIPHPLQPMISFIGLQAANEVKHMKAVQADRLKQLQELRLKLNECSATEIQLVQAIEDEIHFTITAALSADDSRKTASQLSFREDQQIITVTESFLYSTNANAC